MKDFGCWPSCKGWNDDDHGLGNAVVPQQVYPILAGIAQIENSLQE